MSALRVLGRVEAAFEPLLRGVARPNRSRAPPGITFEKQRARTSWNFLYAYTHDHDTIISYHSKNIILLIETLILCILRTWYSQRVSRKSTLGTDRMIVHLVEHRTLKKHMSCESKSKEAPTWRTKVHVHNAQSALPSKNDFHFISTSNSAGQAGAAVCSVSR